jgi:diadenosine tetraphosphate (Ap4A) HIT family hydrolase
MTTCLSCRSNSGEARISPGQPIHEGRFWVVEHAYPSSLLGWTVIVLRRHVEAIHELTSPELAELGQLQGAVARALRHALRCAKEYSVCFAEGPGFEHVHFHLVPRAPNLPPEQRGGGVFVHLRSPEHPVPRSEVARLCEELARLVDDELSAREAR